MRDVASSPTIDLVVLVRTLLHCPYLCTVRACVLSLRSRSSTVTVTSLIDLSLYTYVRVYVYVFQFIHLSFQFPPFLCSYPASTCVHLCVVVMSIYSSVYLPAHPFLSGQVFRFVFCNKGPMGGPSLISHVTRTLLPIHRPSLIRSCSPYVRKLNPPQKIRKPGFWLRWPRIVATGFFLN